MKLSMECVFEIWNDDNGERLEIGPDRDGLDLAEIRCRTPEGKIHSAVTMTMEQVPLVIEAFQNYIAWRKSRETVAR